MIVSRHWRNESGWRYSKLDKNIQNFVSLIPTDNTISLINKYITQLGGSGPITDMAGIWDVLTNGNMTAHDRKMVLDRG